MIEITNVFEGTFVLRFARFKRFVALDEFEEAKIERFIEFTVWVI